MALAEGEMVQAQALKNSRVRSLDAKEPVAQTFEHVKITTIMMNTLL